MRTTPNILQLLIRRPIEEKIRYTVIPNITARPVVCSKYTSHTVPPLRSYHLQARVSPAHLAQDLPEVSPHQFNRHFLISGCHNSHSARSSYHATVFTKPLQKCTLPMRNRNWACTHSAQGRKDWERHIYSTVLGSGMGPQLQAMMCVKNLAKHMTRLNGRLRLELPKCNIHRCPRARRTLFILLKSPPYRGIKSKPCELWRMQVTTIQCIRWSEMMMSHESQRGFRFDDDVEWWR